MSQLVKLNKNAVIDVSLKQTLLGIVNIGVGFFQSNQIPKTKNSEDL